jgi:hypothetical protein
MTAPHVIGVFRPGQPGYLDPGSPEWSKVITPSKVAAILKVSRWESQYSLWQRMAGHVDDAPPKDIYQVGHDAEPYGANRWLHYNPGWRISSGEVQFHIDPKRFGFPAVVTLDRRASRGRSRRCVEIKLARDMNDMDKWGDDFSGDCPDDYWTQVQTQMLFTGWTAIPAQLIALGPFWNEGLYNIAYDSSVADMIVGDCRRFWESLAGDTPPDLDHTVPTYECVRRMHPEIVRDSEVHIPVELADEYHDAVAAKKAAEDRERFAKTRVLDLMGEANFAFADGVKVARRQPNGKSVSLYPVKAKSAVAEGEPAA